MPLFTVDHDKCNQDGLCAADCPAGCIVFEKGSTPVPHEKKQAYCLSCGHCMAICPTDAIRLEEFGESTPLDTSLDITFEQAEQFLKGRRSVRAFKEKALGRDVIQTLLSATCYGPSGHNVRPTRWVVAETREKVTGVAEEMVSWMRGQVDDETPLATALHLPGIVRAWDNGVDMICRNAPALAVAYGPKKGVTPREDAVIGVTYLELAATAAGIGACWCGYVLLGATYDQGLCRMLGVPEDCAVYGALMLGYPARRYKAVPPRSQPDLKWL